MGSKTVESRLIKLLFVLGSLSVKVAFVNIRTTCLLLHEVPSAFNESHIFSGSVVGTSVSSLLRRGVVSIIVREFEAHLVN